MRFVTYNIHYGFGRDGINSLDRIAEAVDGADVIALQEVDRHWPRSGLVDQVASLAKRLPDYWVAYGPTIDLDSPAGFPGEYPTARRQFGNLLLSRRPILSSLNLLLPRPDGVQHTMRRGALEAVVDIGNRPVRVYSTHLDYLSAETRAHQLRALAEHHRLAIAHGGSWNGTHAVDHGWILGDEPDAAVEAVILGDMNIAAGDGEHRAALASTGFIDAWDLAGTGAGATKGGLRIDHCWLTDGLAQAVRSVSVDAAATGSDHQPTWLELDL